MSVFDRSRRWQVALWLFTSLALAIVPTINHLRGGENKDYPLWLETGELFMSGGVVYPPGEVYPFMYPPFAGYVLGILSQLGRDGMFVALLVLNALSLGLAVELSCLMVSGRFQVSPWLRILPATICIFFLNDMFFLGQPNLGLMVLVLAGLMLNRSGWAIGGGALLAAAAAFKAFPAVILVYLLWRREWRASGSMIAFTLLFVLILPATIRGMDQARTDLKWWAEGMLFRQGEEGIGQRPEQSLSWQNQSIFGVGHRLLRHVDYEIVNPNWHTPEYVNLVAWDYKTASMAILAACGVLGVAFIVVMPRRAERTRASDSAEFALLLLLTTIGTPYAYTYYSIWTLFPYTVLVHRALSDANPLVRRVCWGGVGISAGLFAAGVPTFGDHTLQAIGSMFWAEVVLILALGWLIGRPFSPRSDEPTPT